MVNENTPSKVTYVAVNEAKDDRNKESLRKKIGSLNETRM